MHNDNILWREQIVFRLSLLVFLWCILVPDAVCTPAPGDIVIPRSESAGFGVEFTPAAIFPHWIHRVRYRCDACHDSLFKMKLGETEISKALMRENKSCAVCHNGEVAFEVGLDTCNRCHRPLEE